MVVRSAFAGAVGARPDIKGPMRNICALGGVGLGRRLQPLQGEPRTFHARNASRAADRSNTKGTTASGGMMSPPVTATNGAAPNWQGG
ncbi:hypothetical protein STSO111631_05330 [Stackebrandtia soli]